MNVYAKHYDNILGHLLCWNKWVLTDGQPLHWDFTFSATIPTAASLASIDLTTPATSFPAASCRMASVPTNTRVCLDTTLAAVDLRAFTASECVSSATAERMKPSWSVNTVTELDLLLTPKTWGGQSRDNQLGIQSSAQLNGSGRWCTWLCVVNPVSAVLHVSRILVLVTWPLSALYSTVHLPDTSFCSQTLSLLTLAACDKTLETAT